MAIDVDEGAPGQTAPMGSAAAHQIPQAQTQAFTPKPAAQQQQTTQRNMNAIPTTQVMSDRISAPLSATPDAEAMKNFLDSVKEATSNTLDDYVLTVVPINGKDRKLCMSIVVLVLQYGHNGQADASRGLAYHTLLLADTMQEIPPTVVQISGNNYTVPRPPGDAYDKTMREVVIEQLQREFRNVSANLMFDAEAEVIPRGFNYKSQEQVRRALHNASLACAVILAQNSNQNLEDYVLNASASRLNATTRVSTGQPQITDEVGEAVRADIRIDFSEVNATPQAQQPGAGLASMNTGEYATPVFTVGGFMDLLWDPAIGAGTVNPYAPPVTQPGQQLTQLYRPRFVITRFETAKLRTLPGQLLGLASVLALNENFTWISAFKPPKSNVFDMHDIGSIGYEANLDNNPSGIGTRIDTRSDSFREQQLAQLVHAFLKLDMFVSMDVSECGPETWATSVFLAAAQGSTVATEMIFQAANVLTAGNFQKFHPMTGAAVLNDMNRIHLGHYDDKQGVRRDIRDVDYLAVLNTFGDKDPSVIKDWSDSFLRVEYPLEQRMDGRLRIIDRALGGGATVTGYARRITFDTQFLEALLKAILATGLTLRSQTPFQDMSGAPRATAGYLNQSGLSLSGTGLWRSGYGQQAVPGVNIQSGGFGRWR